jgi:predicted RNase H-like nuclease (RuvC/YqgF family)
MVVKMSNAWEEENEKSKKLKQYMAFHRIIKTNNENKDEIKRLNAIIMELEQEIEELKSRIERLDERINRLYEVMGIEQ